MYILTDEPGSGKLGDAFSALDNTFGTGEFSKGQAITVITNELECSAEEASSVFSKLESSSNISEVD